MRVLIDECIDERFRNHLLGHDCQTSRFAGFAGLKNGELLIAAESARFDVLLTVDHGLQFEQNMLGRNIAVLILYTESNRLKDLLTPVPACLGLVPTIKPGPIGA